ncbi:MAG: hypothetical protein Unbinned5930contig1000_13 [Prokaryotic dsDNA virus sp.]|nr:MAG: hypothetical protein Unbinned5930contig1000_13 [Prokaryotic dsDNA virus sp.]|tara:strand:- start:4296 stop:4601 length:306 start_codon:yes stop_codon:yes gene_type:complete
MDNFEDIFEEDDNSLKEINFDELLEGNKATIGQLGMLDHLIDCAMLTEGERQKIKSEYEEYSEAEASACISMLKENLPINDCRDQFIKMCKDGVFKEQGDC